MIIKIPFDTHVPDGWCWGSNKYNTLFATELCKFCILRKKPITRVDSLLELLEESLLQ